jgi:hypothetical protein
LPNSFCSIFSISGINVERSILRGDGFDFIAASIPHIYLDHCESNTIAKSLRRRLSVIEHSQHYIVFSTGGLEFTNNAALVEMLRLNGVEAVQLLHKSFSIDENDSDGLCYVLEKHIREPKLIPHDMEKRKAYIKTLSPELIKYITEKRGISLD